MPVHKIRKRYLLFKWEKQHYHPSRSDLELFLHSNHQAQDETAKLQTSLMILDQDAGMGILKTAHTQVEQVKTHLASGTGESKLPMFGVVAVSGSLKKLKQKLADTRSKVA